MFKSRVIGGAIREGRSVIFAPSDAGVIPFPRWLRGGVVQDRVGTVAIVSMFFLVSCFDRSHVFFKVLISN